MRRTTPSKVATPKGEASKEEILRAAMIEFAGHGMAGARTAEIAKRAGVNIALLFYYFGSKSDLYYAAVDEVLSAWNARVGKTLESQAPAWQRVLDCGAAHFDFIAGDPVRARLVQMELSRRDPQATRFIQALAEKHIKPIFEHLRTTITEAISAGDFRKVDAQQAALTIHTLFGAYFTGAPIVEVLIGREPLSSAALSTRRAAVLDFIAGALMSRESRRDSVPTLGQFKKHSKSRGKSA